VPGGEGGGSRALVAVENLPELGVLARPVAAASDVDDVAVAQEPVDESSGRDLVSKDLAPVLEALVRGEDGRAMLVAPDWSLPDA
jgi:hypothetical protein